MHKKTYYTLNTIELGEEYRRSTLKEIYKDWLQCIQDDKEYGDKKSYYFYKIIVDTANTKIEIKNGVKYTYSKEQIIEGKIYKKGKEYHFKDI